MKGLFIHSGDMERKDSFQDLSLLAKNGDWEIMVQEISKNAVAGFAPSEKEDAFEFYYILNGILEITDSTNNERITLKTGDSITLQGLQQNVIVKCLEYTRLLCVTNVPIFSETTYWQNLLLEQLARIDRMDHYTYSHSHGVMHYAVTLYEELKDHCKSISFRDYAIGALFHDIGKCNIPVEILTKPGRLTDEEYTVIKQHPIESRRILEPMLGEKAAALAGMHHERMDGTGYPNGLKGDEIPFPARILMVADAFDAMTTDRVYRKAMTMEVAADELVKAGKAYDPVVVEALRTMLRENRLEKYEYKPIEFASL